MLRVVKNDTHITINELVNELLDNHCNLIVYYRSQNDREKLPRFLSITKIDEEYLVSFKSPTAIIENDFYSHKAFNLDVAIVECLRKASSSRTLYALELDESQELFKIQIV